MQEVLMLEEFATHHGARLEHIESHVDEEFNVRSEAGVQDPQNGDDKFQVLHEYSATNGQTYQGF